MGNEPVIKQSREPERADCRERGYLTVLGGKE
jgi:hypothetical protein